jgi:membrane-bound lytic murein transglycosylase B
VRGPRRRPVSHAAAWAGLLGVAAACLLPASPASAESAAQAQAEAKRAAGEVAALRPQLQAALRSYDQALAGVSGAVTAGIGADQRASLAQSLAAQERRTQSARARALYMAGGTAALYATARAAAARAAPVPSDMFSLYRAAAPTCPGLPWSVLAAIGQVETGHGRNTNVSSKGATGPMQFLPSTFAAYAVDGDRDGVLDIRSPADAVYTAARYLCRNGGGSPTSLRGAIWNYNHADWYVAMVLRIAAQLAAQSGEPGPSVTAG